MNKFFKVHLNWRINVLVVLAMIITILVAPDFMSTRQAYKMFGRKNVERWRRAGKIQPYVRPGKTEYETAQLRLLQRTEQDYL